MTDLATWLEYDLVMRAQSVLDLLEILDAREREIDDKGRPMGDLRMVGLISDAEGHLRKSIQRMLEMDAHIKEAHKDEHDKYNDEYDS